MSGDFSPALSWIDGVSIPFDDVSMESIFDVGRVLLRSEELFTIGFVFSEEKFRCRTVTSHVKTGRVIS